MKAIVNFFILIILVVQYAFSQEILLEKQNISSKIDDSFSVVNSLNGDISLFLIDKKNIYAYLLNDDYETINSIVSDKLPSKYKVLIGSSISKNNIYRLFLTNNRHKKFGVISFSYTDKEFSMKELDFKPKDEKFIQTVTYNNKLYLITIKKNSSILNIYLFDDNANYKINQIDLSREVLINDLYARVHLYNLLVAPQGFSSNINIKKIDETTPNAIETTSEETKMYIDKDTGKIIFTFDENKDITQIVDIDLNNFGATIKKIEKPKLTEETTVNYRKSNTFIADDKLYALTSSNKELIFTVNDYNTKNLIKEYTLKQDDSITFKNTPIIQEKGSSSVREMEKTRKFLRKITSSDVGIAVYKKNNEYVVTLGGKKEIQRGAMLPMGFGAIGGATAVLISGAFFNPTYFAYSGYTTTKSTYIDCLFDSNFNHIKGDIGKNAFDKVKDFTELPENKNIKAETLFKIKNHTVFGYYSRKSKSYSLVKFED